MIGETLNGRYAILRQLGQGSMGSVYEARHVGTGRRVAVKVIATEIAENPTMAARFQVEARAAGGIDSQHVAQVLDVDRDASNGTPYMVMEYLSGEDLQHVIARLGALPEDLVLRIALQACLGLEKAHAAGIIHRDIKPANIFLSERDGGEIVVKLLDFGVAKMTLEGDDGAGMTRTGSLVGSPLYMSPEQARGSKAIDRRTDAWSLGVVLYQALAGVTPYEGKSGLGELILAICSEPVGPLREKAPWVSAGAERIVGTALSIPVGERYPTVSAMAADLRALLPNGWAIDAAAVVSAQPSVEETGAPTVPFPALRGNGEEAGPRPAAGRRAEVAPPPVAAADAVAPRRTPQFGPNDTVAMNFSPMDFSPALAGLPVEVRTTPAPVKFEPAAPVKAAPAAPVPVELPAPAPALMPTLPPAAARAALAAPAPAEGTPPGSPAEKGLAREDGPFPVVRLAFAIVVGVALLTLLALRYLGGRHLW